MKKILTPVVAGLFLICAITGIALFFHLRPELFHEAHEWLGLPFAALGIWHAGKHWRGMAAYLKHPASLTAMLSVLVAATAFAIVTAKADQGNPRALIQALSKQPLQKVAAVFALTPDQAIENLQSKGISGAAAQPIAQIASQARIPDIAVLLILSGQQPMKEE